MEKITYAKHRERGDDPSVMAIKEPLPYSPERAKKTESDVQKLKGKAEKGAYLLGAQAKMVKEKRDSDRDESPSPRARRK